MFLAWQPPKRELRPARTASQIFLAVGKALTAWEEIETWMAVLFQLLCETDNIAPIRAYGVIENVNGKRQAIEQAFQVFFRDRTETGYSDFDFKDDIPDLLKLYDYLSTLRTNIAHGMAIYLQDTPGPGWFFGPPSYWSRKYKSHGQSSDYYDWKNASYFYSVQNIRDISNKFIELSGHLNGFIAMFWMMCVRLPHAKRLRQESQSTNNPTNDQ